MYRSTKTFTCEPIDISPVCHPYINTENYIVAYERSPNCFYFTKYSLPRRAYLEMLTTSINNNKENMGEGGYCDEFREF